MIRLGSLAGYPFEGPRVLASWPPPAAPGVYAIAYRPQPEQRPEHYAVIYVGEAENLAAIGLPFRHVQAPCWLKRVKDRYRLFICSYDVPGGTAAHRRQIVGELCATYRPGCNETQYEHAWREEWIGDYAAPTTGPLTTGRDPNAPQRAAKPGEQRRG